MEGEEEEDEELNSSTISDRRSGGVSPCDWRIMMMIFVMKVTKMIRDDCFRLCNIVTTNKS